MKKTKKIIIIAVIIILTMTTTFSIAFAITKSEIQIRVDFQNLCLKLADLSECQCHYCQGINRNGKCLGRHEFQSKEELQEILSCGYTAGMDCSSLTWSMMKTSFNINIAENQTYRNSDAIIASAKEKGIAYKLNDVSVLRAGMVLWQNGHVAVVVGWINDKCLVLENGGAGRKGDNGLGKCTYSENRGNDWIGVYLSDIAASVNKGSFTHYIKYEQIQYSETKDYIDLKDYKLVDGELAGRPTYYKVSKLETKLVITFSPSGELITKEAVVSKISKIERKTISDFYSKTCNLNFDEDRIIINIDGQIVSFKEYLKGVMDGEILEYISRRYNNGEDLPLILESVEDCFKAQALVSKSYTLARKGVKNLNNINQMTLDVSSESGEFQCYHSEAERRRTWGGIYNEINAFYDKILKETENQVIVDENENPIQAFFFMCSAGRTRLMSDWYEGSADLPYIVSVECPWDKGICTSSFNMSILDFYSVFGTMYPSQMQIERNRYYEISKMIINGVVYEGNELDNVLNKTGFTSKRLEFSLNQDSEIIVSRIGNGHCVGMSQNSANEMSREGYTYIEIVNYFYKNIKIINQEG